MEIDVSGGGEGAVLKTIMREAVDDDVVIGPDQASDDPITRGPAGWIQNRVLQLQKFRDALLKSQGIFCIAQERRRAGAMDPVIGNRVLRRFLDGWMRSKT